MGSQGCKGDGLQLPQVLAGRLVYLLRPAPPSLALAQKAVPGEEGAGPRERASTRRRRLRRRRRQREIIDFHLGLESRLK